MSGFVIFVVPSDVVCLTAVCNCYPNFDISIK